MKKFLLAFLIFISVAEMKISFGQTYHPFPDSGAQWYECGISIDFTFDVCFYNGYLLTLTRDSVIGNKNYTLVGYNRMFSASYACIGFLLSGIYFDHVLPGPTIGALRSDTTKKIWFRKLNDTITFGGDAYYQLPLDSDVLLYDFNVNVGDSLAWKPNDSKVIQVDSVQLNSGEWRRSITFQWGSTWIEGVGSTFGLVGSYTSLPFEGAYLLSCFKQNDSLLWESLVGFQVDCDHFYTGISEVESANFFSVFPNPITDLITFDLSNFPHEKFTLTIYNPNGQQMNRYSNLHSSQLTIPTSQLGADGLYFYTLNFDGKKIYSGKFIVQR